MTNCNRLLLHSVCVAATLACVLGRTGPAAASEPSVAGFSGSPSIGVNLEGVSDHARMPVFADLMKASRAWGSADRPWEHDVTVDENGWPTRDAGVVVRIMQTDPGSRSTSPRTMTPGVYPLSFQGKANVRPVASPSVTVRHLRHDHQRNHSTADVVVGASATQLMLSFTGTEGGVKEVRLHPPDHAAGETFNKDFLQALKPFAVLRLMNFLAANGNTVGSWGARTRPDFASQAGRRGVAYEYAIQLANETGKDLWLTIPVHADDAYVQSLAELLKHSLDPRRAVYLEYSNELWNHDFPQTRDNIRAAVAEALAGDLTLTAGQACTPEAFAANKGPCNSFWAGQFRAGKRIVRIGEIFARVFGNAAMHQRIRPVLATQFANRAIAEQVLKNIARYRGKPSGVLHGIASAPYFQLDKALAESASASVEQLLDGLGESLYRQNLPYFPAGTGSKVFMRQAVYRGEDWSGASQKALADYWGLRSLAYEGGPDLRQADVNLPAKYEASLHPRMGQLIERQLRQWFGCGNDMFVYYSLSSAYNRHGYWGLTHDPSNVDTAKFAAVRRVANSTISPADCRDAQR